MIENILIGIGLGLLLNVIIWIPWIFLIRWVFKEEDCPDCPHPP